MESNDNLKQIKIIIHNGAETHELWVENGRNLRQILLENNLTPYAWLTRQLNCGGRGLCATCGVWVEEEPTPPIGTISSPSNMATRASPAKSPSNPT